MKRILFILFVGLLSLNAVDKNFKQKDEMLLNKMEKLVNQLEPLEEKWLIADANHNDCVNSIFDKYGYQTEEAFKKTHNKLCKKTI